MQITNATTHQPATTPLTEQAHDEPADDAHDNAHDADVPAQCPPWRLGIVRAVLLGTHDAQSPLHQLQAQHRLLELIIRRWVWPELFLNALVAATLEANPGAVTEAELRERLELNPDGSIRSWHLHRCGLRALPELFGAVCTTGNLWLSRNKLRSLPDSFGSITVGGSLVLDDNQLSSLPDSFGSITVGRDLFLSSNRLSSLPDSFGSITVGGDLWLKNNQLQDQDIPAQLIWYTQI